MIDQAMKDPESAKVPADGVPTLCQGTGWKTVTARPCRIEPERPPGHALRLPVAGARGIVADGAARIPRRYEHCELSNYDTDFPGAHPSLEEAHFIASGFAKKCDPRGDKGLLIIGKIGTGKTHLAVGIIKELIVNRGIPCLFYDYRELLKEIQNSYNSTVQTTELDVLRPVFETDVLVLDELGAVKPTEWVWDTVSLILNTRYNDNRTTIITTNFDDQPAAGAAGSISPARAATRGETSGRPYRRTHAFAAARNVPHRHAGRHGLPPEIPQRQLPVDFFATDPHGFTRMKTTPDGRGLATRFPWIYPCDPRKSVAKEVLPGIL